jgi:2-polyprenyl-3-methyl-5-hydroxy-6-metoxy-1,4-benzoquinol methylase
MELMDDRINPWTEAAQWNIEGSAEMLDPVDWAGKKVLDVGCWWGWFMRYAAEKGATVVGFDHEASQVRDAVDYLRARSNLCVADAAHMPFAAGTFDVVVSIHVLEHVEPEQGMIDEVKRVLRPDGLLLLFVPNDFSLGVLPYRPLRLLLHGQRATMLPPKLYRYLKSITYSDPTHHREYSVRSIKKVLQSNGFGIERLRSHGLQMPYPLTGRLSRRARHWISSYLGSIVPEIIRASIAIHARKAGGASNLVKGKQPE